MYCHSVRYPALPRRLPRSPCSPAGRMPGASLPGQAMEAGRGAAAAAASQAATEMLQVHCLADCLARCLPACLPALAAAPCWLAAADPLPVLHLVSRHTPSADCTFIRLFACPQAAKQAVGLPAGKPMVEGAEQAAYKVSGPDCQECMLGGVEGGGLLGVVDGAVKVQLPGCWALLPTR